MRTLPLRRVARILNGGTPTADTDNWGGEVPWATPVDLARVDGRTLGTTDRTLTQQGLDSGSLLAPEGSVLLSTRAPVGYTATLTEPTAFNQGCKAVVPRHGHDSRFLQLCLMVGRPTLEAAGTGSTFKELGNEALLQHGVPVMGMAEQRRIADFLDDQVARIDRIIAARRQQITGVTACHQALVDNLAAPTDESPGVGASRVIHVLPGWAFPSSGFTSDADDVRLLRGVNVGVGELRWNDSAYWPQQRVTDLAKFALAEGDIVLGMDRPWIGSGLRIAVVRRQDLPALLLQRVAKLVPNHQVLGKYVYWMYRAGSFRMVAEDDLTGLSVPHISPDQIASHQIPQRSLDEQTRAVSALDASEAHAKTVGAGLSRSIDLLTEYRQSLITAAVTGEFDVTAASGRGVPA